MLKQSIKNIIKNVCLGGVVGTLIFITPTALVVLADEDTTYHSFIEENASVAYFDGQEKVMDKDLSISNQKSIETTIQVPKTALYFLDVSYTLETESVLPTQISLSVNGDIPYQELANLQFKDNWQLGTEVELDRYGNEIAPKANACHERKSSLLYDPSYYVEEPLAILLQAGENTLTFTSVEGGVTIHSLTVEGKTETGSFDLAADPDEKVTGEKRVVTEAENITQQNASSIHPSAAFDDNLTPYNSTKRVLNFLDGTSFSSAGDKVSYEVEIKESGYYYLTLNYRQDAKIDFPVFVNIAINDEIPSQSLQAQPIPYRSSFGEYTLLNKENDQQLPIYLEKGKQQVSLQITASPTGEILTRVAAIIKEMQALSLEVDNLLGSNVDKNRDIDLESYLPGTLAKLDAWAQELAGFEKSTQEVAGVDETPGAFAQLTIARKQLEALQEKPRKLANRINELSKDAGSIAANLATLLQDATNHGLSIDQLVFHQAEKTEIDKPGLFNKASNSFKRFVNSFGQQDYTVDSESDNIQVWVNRPRQYVEMMQQMVDQDFTSQTGIKVDLSLMPDANKLILANASGTAPDVALGVNYAMPFDMGIRDALVDLSQFDGYEELMTEYPEKLLKPAMIGSKVFAIPETMNFYVLFYRTDVLKSLGLEVPDTMEDLIEMLPALNQRGMSAFYPTATLGTSFKIFPWTMPVVYQNGGSFYTEDITKTGLNKDVTIDGMQALTDLFTIYNMPKDVPSFYQQFRDGSVPIGVADYGNYNLIVNAAPEIANVWDIALMPGYENSEGEVERFSSGGAESAIMFESSEDQEDAWQFMQWWLSASVQQEFGTNLQMTYGNEYMWNSANQKAFQELPWPSTDKNVILAQSEWIEEVPRVLGSYMTEREVSNVYNSVVVDGKNLRKAIDLSTKRINRETLRKLEEFGYYSDGEMILPYPMPEEKEGDK